MREIIYGLVSEGSSEVMYVGRTKRVLAARLKAHQYAMKRAQQGKNIRPVYGWLWEMHESDTPVNIVQLDSVDSIDAYESEWAWITKLQPQLNLQGNTRSDAKWHGTSGGYSGHRCRCAPCKAAWAALVRAGKERRKQSVPAHSSGSLNYYGNYGCRCSPCTSAWTAAAKERKERRARLGDQSENVGKSNRGSGRLSKEDIQDIVDKYRSGIKTDELAAEYDISNAAISLALRGRIHG